MTALGFARRAARIPQQTLAAEVGITPGALCQIEKGIESPSAEVAARLASALRIPVTLVTARPLSGRRAPSHTQLLQALDVLLAWGEAESRHRHRCRGATEGGAP